MTQQVNITGWIFGQGYDLGPGDEQTWYVFGPVAENGVVTWMSVKPFPAGVGFPGEKFLEVTQFRHEATDDGGRRIFFTVKNTGVNPILAYAIYFAYTDVITG